MKKLVLVSILVAVCCGQLQAGDKLGFEREIIDADNAGRCAIGDIDGDGFNDVVVHTWGTNRGQEADGTIVWYRYPNWEKTIIKNNAHIFGDEVLAADLDDDGDNDVITCLGSDNSSQVWWFENPGGLATETWPEYHIGTLETKSEIKDIEVHDIDGDGLKDVVARSKHKFAVFFQDTPTSWTTIKFENIEREGMTIGDVDNDGDWDVVMNGFWFENPENARTGNWDKYVIDPQWYTDTTGRWQDHSVMAAVADIDGDGKNDVVFSHSEKPGFEVSWYSSDNPKGGAAAWARHNIGVVDYCHTLRADDLDLDGDIDIVAGNIPRLPEPKMFAFLNKGKGRKWKKTTVAESSVYKAKTGDIDKDGDIDIVAARSWEDPPVQVWRNTLKAGSKQTLDKWTYIQIDDSKGRWSQWAPPKFMRYFGLWMKDITGDGYKDIVSGRYFYRNPGGDMTGKWERVDLGLNADGMIFVDVDGDQFGDIIAEALPNVYWLEAEDKQGNSWKATVIGQIPPTSHANGQGYTLGQIVPGGKQEIVLTCGGGLYYFEIPKKPEKGDWPKVHVSAEAFDEGVAAGDIDGDGFDDLTAFIEQKKGDFEGGMVAWWKNPGDGSGDWKRFDLRGPNNPIPHPGDRFEIADIDGDNKPDVIVTEERYPGFEPDSNLYWFEQPYNPKRPYWVKHTVVTQYSMNNLDVGDIDNDGDSDIVTCEHKGSVKKLQIFENGGQGKFIEHLIDTGKENHLGTQLADMDGDGDLDIVGAGWEQWKFMHLWRNDAKSK